jgi:hypothetical protein
MIIPDFTDFFFFDRPESNDILNHPNIGLASEIYDWLMEWRQTNKPTAMGAWDYLFDQGHSDWWQEKTVKEQAEHLERVYDLLVPDFELAIPLEDIDKYIGVSVSDLPQAILDLGPILDFDNVRTVFKWK